MNTHLEKGKKIYSCFIDFKKAYDSVWRTGLFYKLIKTGADLDLIKIIKSMYEQSKQTNFKFESYLDNIPKNIRKYTTRLRRSSHNFPVETLRYKKLPRSERLCKICNKQQIGDEEHYLINCNNHYMREERETYLIKMRKTNTQFLNFDNRQII